MAGSTIKNEKTDNKQQDMWRMIDEIEEKYADLINDLERETSHQGGHMKMKITGMSIREIPRIQEKRRKKK